MASQTEAEGLSEGLHLALTGVGQRWARLKSCLDGCLSRLASYQQRVGVATGRVAALKGHWGQTTCDTGQRFFPENQFFENVCPIFYPCPPRIFLLLT